MPGGIEGLAEPFARFGLGGLVIFALFAALFYMIHTQSRERTEWRKQAEKQSDQANATAKDGHEVIRRLTATIEGINR